MKDIPMRSYQSKIKTPSRNNKGKIKAKQTQRTQVTETMFFPPKLFVTIIGLLGLCRIITSLPDTTVERVLCNTGVYSPGDPFGTSLAYVIDELETVTPTRKNHDYYNISPYPNAFAYGHADCNKNLTSSDCSTCLGAAKAAMFGNCQSRIGARAELSDCSIRYEQYPFTV